MDDRMRPPPRDPEDLPTLELEIQAIKKQVADVAKEVAWLRRSAQVWARGRDSRPERQGDADATR